MLNHYIQYCPNCQCVICVRRRSDTESMVMGFTMNDLINFRRICDTYILTSFEIGEILARNKWVR